MIKKIVQWPDPVLNTVGKDVTKFSELLHTLVKDMFETMYANEGIGLAAQQIGEDQRVLVIDTTQVAGGTIKQDIINPVIDMSIGQEVIEKEGCLSFPGVYVKVKRRSHVVVTGSSITGEAVEIVADGIDARCLQHEIDHVNGITFYDRLSNVQKSLYQNKFKKLKKRKI